MTFRNPVNNQRYTKQLFYDMYINLPYAVRTTEPLFTLHHDVEGYTNFRKEYIKDRDPTGYKTAVRLLENYDHFLLLMKSSWFAEAKKIWDEELSAKLEAEATDVALSIMKDQDLKPTERLAAAKLILGKAKATGKPDKAPRGRPTKEEVQGNLKIETEAEKALNDDLARIGWKG